MTFLRALGASSAIVFTFDVSQWQAAAVAIACYLVALK